MVVIVYSSFIVISHLVFRLGFACPINYNPAEYYVKLLSTNEVVAAQCEDAAKHLCNGSTEKEMYILDKSM